MPLKIHFAYKPDNAEIASFAQKFIEKLGDAPIADADVIVPVGGDGSLLFAFNRASKGQKIFGIVPSNGKSVAFWDHRGIDTPEQLLESMDAAESYNIAPLRADIRLQNGELKTVCAYNDFSPSEFGPQAMAAQLTIQDGDKKIGPARIIGGGLIISTPYGSTAMNMLHSGSVIDLRSPSIVLTGDGLRGPKGIFTSAVLPDSVSIDLQFEDQGRRPVRLKYDGMAVISDPENPFDRVTISKESSRSTQLLLTQKPSIRALAHLI